MENIMDIIIKVAATLLAMGLGYLGKFAIQWLKGKLNEQQTEKLDLFVTELCYAAEQMFKEADPDGTIRRRYVENMLSQAGYELTDAVRALIESKVFEINLTNGITEGVAEGGGANG